MFTRRLIESVAILAALFVVGIASAEDPAAKKVDAKEDYQPYLMAAQIRSPHILIGITTEGALVSIDTRWGTTRDYGKFEGVLPSLEVRKDRACLVTAKEILCVALASGKVQRAPHELGPRVAAGFLDDDRIFVQDGSRLQIFRRGGGEKVHDVLLNKTARLNPFADVLALKPCHLVHGQHLFIAHWREGVAVVDVRDGRLVKTLLARNVTGLVATNGKLFAKCVTGSYGIVHESLQLWDLATFTSEANLSLEAMRGKETRMARQGVTIGGIVIASGLLHAVVDRDILQLTPEGRLVGIARNALHPKEHLVSNGKLPFTTAKNNVNRIRVTPARPAVAAQADGK